MVAKDGKKRARKTKETWILSVNSQIRSPKRSHGIFSQSKIHPRYYINPIDYCQKFPK